MMKSLTLVGNGEKKSDTRFVVVIDQLVRSGWEFINRALLRWPKPFGHPASAWLVSSGYVALSCKLLLK